LSRVEDRKYAIHGLSRQVRERFDTMMERCMACDNPFLRAAAQGGVGSFCNVVLDFGLNYMSSLLEGSQTMGQRLDDLEDRVKRLEGLVGGTSGTTAAATVALGVER